ncbi:Pkinase_Tyr domain-containing protein/EDR1 domain-containing protein [Cephalotus follicularis]|uniref:non-specific serine/threonine protein kinase n=1 Tax=Cephalotus follicularis TaxID=3775 RepID=A0A1Q3AMJ1_CEPFO|nr:Pkinase_Tyr domain-containing protein/EDR1 domain-containing protein [Cephalotus follicularis]
MSKMKHLLRKLHIGGGLNEHHHQRLDETQPVQSNASPTQSASPSSSGAGIGAVESVVSTDRTAGDACVDFNFMEEEFQVQLALAMSASDPDSRGDAETAQIDAAKRISLGPSAAPLNDADPLVEFLSLRYWSYNVVNYNDKVIDGFYDVYGITSNLVTQGKMPLLVDLQAISVSDNVDHEVILVNRLVDPELQELEKRAYAVSVDCRAYEYGPDLNGLIQKIADIVVSRMGGPVGDADEMLKRWTLRSYELRHSLNSIILPLGRLDVGLSRHRALLFKVLADRINLPCMLVKGSCYTGTDDGAVNFIRIDNGSEYIIDLMGAPGTLIPAEVPSSHLPNSGLALTGFVDFTETSKGSCLVLDKGAESLGDLPILDKFHKGGCSRLEEALIVGSETNKVERGLAKRNQTERFEHDFGNLPPLHKLCESSSGISGNSSAQKMKVKNVSKYVISAAKNPEFAQKLHAVLLESGASPPPDLFLDINAQDQGEERMLELLHLENGKIVDEGVHCHPHKFLSRLEKSHNSSVAQESSSNASCWNSKQKQCDEELVQLQREMDTKAIISNGCFPFDTASEGFVLLGNGINELIMTDAAAVSTVLVKPSGMVARDLYEKQSHKFSYDSTAESSQRQVEDVLISDNSPKRTMFDNPDFYKRSSGDLMDTTNSGLLVASNGYSDRLTPMLGEVEEWEIPWEDLQIGERIGIGSYGEVYHADWNGTEVAVKKFLDQDFSGDALIQFRCEVEIMLRLRHPNVVLFMGAVTRPPHFSILTEFLPRGSLYRLLHRPNSLLDEKRRMRMALDVAKGMNYLHTSHPTIVHRDLKSPNLLVDKNWVVKVCDFGLSRMKHHTFLSSKSTAGTPEWMAPEVLRNEPANEKCDVYSFGVILWELATLRIPWKGLNPMQVVGAVGFQDRRLEIPEDIDPAVAQIIQDCWQRKPDLRPSFTQLMSRLRRLQRLFIYRTNSTTQTTE